MISANHGIALDCEWIGSKNRSLLQVGVSFIVNSQVKSTELYIIAENFHRESTLYVITDKYSFRHGESYVMPLKDVLAKVQGLVNAYQCVVGHDYKQDLQILGISHLKQAHTPIHFFDTQSLFKDLHNRNKVGAKIKSVSLVKMHQALGFTEHLEAHNAANDALMTAKSFIELQRLLRIEK